jgi:glycerol uptake facilitator-like aquaporin
VWLRLSSALLVAASRFLRTLRRVALKLFHETTGALFVVLAGVGAVSAWREWRRGSAEWLIALAVGFAVAMAAFAVASFRSAGRIR